MPFLSVMHLQVEPPPVTVLSCWDWSCTTGLRLTLSFAVRVVAFFTAYPARDRRSYR